MQKYTTFSTLLKQLVHNRQSIKSIVYNNIHNPLLLKQAYNILLKANQYYPHLLEIVHALELKTKTHFTNPYLVIVFLLELFNPENTKSKRIGGQITKLLKSNATFIHSLLAHYAIDLTQHKLKSLVTLRVLDLNDPFTISQLSAIEYKQDKHIPELIYISQPTYKSLLQNTRWYIPQSKSSAMPPFILFKQIKSSDKCFQFDVIDCCASPGNKTIQLASYMLQRKVKGKVHAFERNPTRFNTLESRVKHYGYEHMIKCSLMNFMDVEPKDYQSVKLIMLDPSCSGSGMVQNSKFKPVSQEQISKLAEVQLRLLEKCTKFANAIRIIYSTCSVHQEENEDVCSKFLSRNAEWQDVRILPSWKTRGIGNTNYIRVEKSANTDGFFIAMFGRR